MLKKNNKINKTKEFDHVFKQGRSSFDKIIGVKFIENNLNESRFGVIVGTKISKKAPIRNKIKRQIRAVIFKELPYIKNNIDCIIITLPDIIEKDFNDIQISIQKHFKKLRFYK